MCVILLILKLPTISKDLDFNPSAIVLPLCLPFESVLSDLGENARYLYGITPWIPSSKIVGQNPDWSAKEFNDRLHMSYLQLGYYD